MFEKLRKKAVPGAALDLKEIDELDAGRWYLKQARELEKSKQAEIQKRAELAWKGMQWMGAVTIISIFGILYLVLLKIPNPPAVLRVDNATGKVDVLPTTTGKVAFGEKADRADLRRYVEMRESYDWETIQDMHDAVMMMSSGQEGDLYNTFINSTSSPLKLLKDQARVIAKVGVITFVGATAQVFFSKEYVPLNPVLRRETTYWVSTIVYRHDDVPEKKDQQDINPTGWKATSYTVTRDWTRAPAEYPQQASSTAVMSDPVTVVGGGQ